MAIMNEGRIICKGEPQNVIDELNNSVWQKLIKRNELESYKNTFDVISNKMIGGKPLIHVLSPQQPEEGFQQVNPTLEDVFFAKINTTQNNLKSSQHV